MTATADDGRGGVRLHRQEHERLESLRSYGVLDTAPEPAFDALTELAALICRVPVAMMTLVDQDRQWFKATQGLALRETRREFSFCSDAVACEAPLVLADASKDPRYASNPFVAAEPGVRAYAGMPLIGRDGLPLGALCVLDWRPRRFTARQLDALASLARQATDQLELRRLDRVTGRAAEVLDGEAADPVRLRRALDSGELVAHFQPIADLRSGRTVGLEALVRWQHPVRGLLPPAAFLPAVETSQLIVSLGRLVLEQSVALLTRLDADPRTSRSLGVAVNVSGAQLRGPGLAQDVLDVLGRHCVAPERLTLEITETAALPGTSFAASELRVLREAGVLLALDDYGVGWSALGRLLELPLTSLKLDRSLVSGLPDDRRSRAIAASTARMAAEMGLALVGEGVESEAQRQALLALGAGAGQGWLFGRPVDEAAATARLLSESSAFVPTPRPVGDGARAVAGTAAHPGADRP